MTDRITAFVIPHTHWDREWYRSFQSFRARLIEVVDAVLDLLDRRDDFPCFTLDGQAVLLEDYLELRPERRGDIERQVRAGRLFVGPWYVLADEFLVSPEALIRNLQLGRRVCEPFGGAMEVGYTPDSFGHIAQLPLLLRGFGIDCVVFERGVGDEGERLGAEFEWLGLDGDSRVFAVHLIGTYSAVAALGHRDWELGDPLDPDLLVRHLRLALDGPDPATPPPEIPAWLLDSLQRIDGGARRYARSRALPLLNGSDHLFAQTDLPRALTLAAEAFPDVDIVHGHLGGFVAAARSSAGPLEIHCGEFRGGRYHHVLSGTLSSRMPLKLANHRVETLLERYAEPLAARGWLAGGSYPAAVMDQAWRLLLRNHPHDSICGCSIDEVHREMDVRFDGAVHLGELLADGGVAALAPAPAPGIAPSHAVFNPAPYPRREVVELTVEVPAGTGGSLQVSLAHDPDPGTPLPSEIRVESGFPPGRSAPAIDRVRLRCLLELPPLSLTPLRVAPGPAPTPDPGDDRATLTRHGDALVLENRHVRARIEADGSLLLDDLARGTRTQLRLAFEDIADAGDSYDHSPLAAESPLRIDRPTKVAAGASGPLRCSAELRYETALPLRLSPDRSERVGEVPLELRVELALAAGGRALLLHVAFENRAEDHRLRLLVESDLACERVRAGGHFATIERPLRPAAGDDWFQAPQPTSHMRQLLLAADGERALALLSRGLTEYEAIPEAPGTTLAVTLLRSVGWLSRDDLRSRPQGAGPALPVPEAQCLGAHAVDLALLPLSEPWWRGPLSETLDAFIAPARVFARPATAPPLLELTPPLLLSACKRAASGAGCVVRVWNPAPEPIEGSLSAPAATGIYRVDLAEERLERLDTGGPLPLRLAANEVRSFELLFPKGGDHLGPEERPDPNSS